MPVYKDEKRGTWFAKFQYHDWTGTIRTKLKRGFALKKEAQEFERKFLEKEAGNCNMNFASFVEIYLAYSQKRNRPSTYANKVTMIENHILPYFKNLQLNEVTPAKIHQWQEIKIEEEHLPTYLRSMHSRLSSIFNHAVNYYNLSKNPCRKAGTMGSKKAQTIDFWTLDEYNTFLPAVSNKPRSAIGFELLYWGGFRIGELLAFTAEDYSKERGGIRINKTWQIVEGEEIIGPPKTASSERFTKLPPFLCAKLEDYMSRLYGLEPTDRVFEDCTSSYFAKEIDRGSQASGVKRIRIHDLRHSHVSLLIDQGYDYKMIAERIGHTDIKYIMETYGHLYPTRMDDMIQNLENLKVLK